MIAGIKLSKLRDKIVELDTSRFFLQLAQWRTMCKLISTALLGFSLVGDFVFSSRR
jgi:hypothetical protein